MYRSLRSTIFAVVTTACLAIGGYFATGAAMAAYAFDIPLLLPVGESLALDRLAHSAMLGAADPNLVCQRAFTERAAVHDLFSAGGFTLTEYGARC
ncbi:hypothetical protein [Paradevosia shaoguanensis]|uniref:hypothetical protein n=1 Tax=Paradevosia shaoguanensis TaxID=1335043 RepID=UPI001933E7FB|nr:hypothetical protein [Paradevosia shaoguanensis]